MFAILVKGWFRTLEFEKWNLNCESGISVFCFFWSSMGKIQKVDFGFFSVFSLGSTEFGKTPL